MSVKLITSMSSQIECSDDALLKEFSQIQELINEYSISKNIKETEHFL